jgi:colanic acid/amylovoran biosynthesis glycosyltransferase
MKITSSATIGYIVSVLPACTHTFITREIQYLINRGKKIKIYSIHHASKGSYYKEDEWILKIAFYLFPLNILKFVKSNIYFIKSKTKVYFSIIFACFFGSHVCFSNRIKSLYHFFEGVYLAKNIINDDISHLHAHFAGGPATCAMVASKITGIPFSFTAHGTGLLIEKLLLKEKIQWSAFIVAISSYNKRQICVQNHDSEDKIYVVPCGTDTAQFRPNLKPRTGTTLLTVASLKPVKDYPTLIGACKILKTLNECFRLIIVGEGPDRPKIEKLINKWGLNKIVTLVGAVPSSRINKFYDKADIFVLASYSEGIPVVLMEAMAKQIPVIATKITGIPELVENNKSGILVEPKDPQALALAIRKLIKDKTLRNAMGTNGRIKVL